MDVAKLKNAAVVVTAVVTIVSGIDKIKTIYKVWRKEYDDAKEANSIKKKNLL